MSRLVEAHSMPEPVHQGSEEQRDHHTLPQAETRPAQNPVHQGERGPELLPTATLAGFEERRNQDFPSLVEARPVQNPPVGSLAARLQEA
ncbi:unnamed protein product [Lampetra planeri]